ncbi:receptor-like serine/threonine-protein kinase SD1-8 [Phalaenopsis equestris]|uniref:receptor-like serine/threonine-protein kinase SD1-8 n=1 Tax=Phalaenopsis equestris TaxID=78828 RepID=UPI0009E62491|nr:receptor-like serine/threonine-protein kinase SD1-8 [Phalaenopsis equestris]
MRSFSLLLLFLSNLLHNSSAEDIITPNSSIKDGQTLISAGGIFELGFFHPGSSKMRFLGIWYKKIPVQTVVWVANRGAPLSDSSGSLQIGETGNLILFDGSQKAIWSTTAASSNSSNTIAQLLDNGNFVLRNNGSTVSESFIWESFYSPCDTLLPGMKLGWNLKTGLESKLTTWKSSDDPSNGDYTFSLDVRGAPEFFLRHGTQPVYRNGPWTGFQFSGEPEMTANSYVSFDFISNGDEIYYAYKVIDSSITFRLVLNQSNIQRYLWHDSLSSWSLYWSVPRDQCDSYADCGPYGFCNPNYSPVCSCVHGFKPKNLQNWNLRDGSDGCVRVTNLDCEKGDGFLKMSGIKLPDTTTAVVVESVSLDQCRLSCLKNCSCLAYASANISAGGSGCITWGSELMDLKQFADGGQDFYIRLAASELRGDLKKKHVIIIVVVVVSMMFLLGFTGFCFWKKKRMMNITGYWRNKPRQLSFDAVITEHLSDNEDSRRKNTDLPLFNFETILISTGNFSTANKIGEGGFGIVYKGKLEDGQEIAVKRLSKGSLQGTTEFKNEVMLIVKLQHINLVRLLGCCIQGEEKMLVYEYLQNKSLDTIIFDKTKSYLLSWPMRFKIIVGIARGLVYLHQDSRFRIIHRDLKASNILLDQEMNPKISDFGLARIFGGEENSTYTNRVVGTYGYMSPEYAMDGIFSTKSDVFSFGVLVLEIVSGKKNKGIHISDQRINLLAHAWNLWKEGKAADQLFDDSLGDLSSEPEVLRCIQLGLLCAQERADDRPSMSMVLMMLLSSNTMLPQPKNPGFWDGGGSSDMKLSWSFSTNDMSVTRLEGR